LSCPTGIAITFKKVKVVKQKSSLKNNWQQRSYNITLSPGEGRGEAQHITKITEPALSLPKRDKSVIKSRHFSDIIVNKMLTINVLTRF